MQRRRLPSAVMIIIDQLDQRLTEMLGILVEFRANRLVLLDRLEKRGFSRH